MEIQPSKMKETILHILKCSVYDLILKFFNRKFSLNNFFNSEEKRYLLAKSWHVFLTLLFIRNSLKKKHNLNNIIL